MSEERTKLATPFGSRIFNGYNNTTENMKLKSRIKSKHYQQGTRIVQKFIVELQVKPRGVWLPLGDDDGTKKFDTKAEAELEEFKVMKPKAARLAQMDS